MSTEMKEALIQLKNIRKSYSSEVEILKGITLDLYQGEWTNIMGPSGSGKTTLLNIIGCLDQASQGALIIGDEDVSIKNDKALAQFRRETVGLIFQQYHLVPYLTAVENVMLAQHFHSTIDEAEAIEALQTVGLGHRLDHIPGRLSGGEQQRVAIARALINKPKILLADEPTGNLDEANSERILELFRELREKGHTIVMVTHSPEIGALGDRLVMLRDGLVKSNTETEGLKVG